MTLKGLMLSTRTLAADHPNMKSRNILLMPAIHLKQRLLVQF